MAETALVIIDIQNDFLHPDGAYSRGGATAPALSAVVEPIVKLCESARSAGVPVVASRFTLWPGPGGQPLIDPHLAELRPFLGGSDFAPGSWGHETLAELGPVDAAVDKVAYSAFAHTRLGWWLERIGVRHIAVCGIVTNGGVASTVHDAHVRGLRVSVIDDACAAFDEELHDATLRSLGSIANRSTVGRQCEDWK
jgi:nicotinamidase-related amidase